MTASLTYHDNVAAVAGVLDAASVTQLYVQGKAAIQTCKRLDIDFSNVTHSNSTGLCLMLGWLRYARKQNKLIQFHHLPDQMLAMADLCDLNSLLPIVVSET